MKWLSTERGEKIDMIGVKPELWNLKLFVWSAIFLYSGVEIEIQESHTSPLGCS